MNPSDREWLRNLEWTCKKDAMANPNELSALRQMICQFRVSELTSLLHSQNRPKTGRKRELMERSLDLLNGTITNELKRKIQELDQLRNPSRMHQYHGPGIAMSDLDAFGAVGDLFINDDSGLGVPPLKGPVMKAEPGVKLRPLAFYDKIESILKPSKIPGNGTRMSGTQFWIRIPKTCMDKFKAGQGATKEKYLFLLRFFDLSSVSLGHSILNDDLPLSIRLRINDRETTLPPHIPPSKAGVEPRRQKKPVNITPELRHVIEKAIIANLSYIDIGVWCQWKEENQTRRWGVSVDLSEGIPAEQVLERVKANVVPKEETINLIREKLDPNADVACGSISASLQCPVGCIRMTTPVRTRQCSHFQCFDADPYLRMNEKKPTWNCPVCHKKAYFNELVVDEYFAEICKKSKANEVDFEPTGGWTEHKEKKEKKPRVEQPVVSKPDDIVALDDSDDEAPTKESMQEQIDNMKTEEELTFAPAATPTGDDSIICISDDSDDEAAVSPTPKRSRMEPRTTSSPAVHQNGMIGQENVTPIPHHSSQTPSTSSRPPSNIRSHSENPKAAHIPQPDVDALNQYLTPLLGQNPDPNHAAAILQLLASQSHLTQHNANAPPNFSHTQTLASTDPTHWESCNLAISNLQRQLALLLSNPSPELREVSQQVMVCQAIIGNGRLPSSHMATLQASLNAVTSVASSQANSSTIGRQPRIDQMFAPTSRPMSTSSKPSDKPLEPKQEPS
ncbi:Oidioi.mRNA.OKI2018_I69.chr2.g7927.t1.cds [Oikopleura dioica]|uniref:Oidioi.mRNA.OKI2018_I69.chr2.g7927.t1.cds n=1 Tax=Oikopleura dioica TaxID=34765 RepID=A0ABN7TB28_OIKDI|nr:Oidioi.mRNA.OKI2018_I69.chr2.g7927.t1.cds [Oikopleura dioica]